METNKKSKISKITSILISALIIAGVFTYFDAEQQPIKEEVTNTATTTTTIADEFTVVEDTTDVESIKEVDDTQPLDANVGNMNIGSWISTDDPKAVVHCNEDGTLVEIYDGQVIRESLWSLNGKALNVVSDLYTMTYTILNVDENNLSVSYSSRGNTLNYRRLPKVE